MITGSPATWPTYHGTLTGVSRGVLFLLGLVRTIVNLSSRARTALVGGRAMGATSFRSVAYHGTLIGVSRGVLFLLGLVRTVVNLSSRARAALVGEKATEATSFRSVAWPLQQCRLLRSSAIDLEY